MFLLTGLDLSRSGVGGRLLLVSPFGSGKQVVPHAVTVADPFTAHKESILIGG